MPYVNFTLQDIFGIVIAFLLFPLFLFIPGYFIGWISNSLNFRHRSLPLKVLLSLVLSVSVWPIATFLVARFLSMQAVWILHIFVWIAFVYLCIQSVISTKSNSNKARFRLNRYLMIGLALVIVWCVIAILSLIDLQIGNKLYFSVMSYDYGLRTSITNAITRTGIPPTNPSFYPGHPLGVSYYYFWFLLCSLVEQMTGSWIEARYAVMGGTLWIGIILMATIAVYLRFQTAQGAKNIQIRSIIGALLLFVTGLDILPVAALNINRLRAHLPLLFDMILKSLHG